MALQKSTTTPQGFQADDAYHRVMYVGFQGKESITFSVESFKSADASVNFDSKSFACAYDMNGANPFQQAYSYLKTLPEFAGAVDC